MKCAVVLLLIVLLVGDAHCAPLFKVFCNGTPLYRGRADSIVQPGVVSMHVHKVAGGSNFGVGSATDTPLQSFQDMRNSPCTTCSIDKVDLSAYWHPDLYYRWPNGTFSLVPKGGLTIYYLHRSGSGSQANPSWTAFPPGLRMVSGNPFRRSFNASNVSERAINYACLSSTSNGPETNGFPTGRNCNNGLRLQLHFPQCWDGKNLDATDHKSHMAFPIENPDGGNCPSTHPVRVPNLFFEAFYSVSDFPHGGAPGTPTYQPFVLSCGDATGYGFHGDFLNGWDQQVLQNAIRDPTCDISNTAFGNNVRNCQTLSQYVQDTKDGKCKVNRPIHLTESLGLGQALMTSLPGCNPVTSGPNPGTPCVGLPTDTFKFPISARFHLKASNGKYVTAPSESDTYALAASYTGLPTYYEVFATAPASTGWVGIQAEATAKWISASGNNGALWGNRGSVSGWEEFKFISQTGGKVGILSNRNQKYISLQADGVTLAPTASSIGTNELFTQEVPNGGGV